MGREVVVFRPLSDATLADDERRFCGMHYIAPDHAVSRIESHRADAPGAASHGPELHLRNAERLSLFRHEQKIVRTGCEAHLGDLVPFVQGEHPLPGTREAGEFRNSQTLGRSVPGDEEYVLRVFHAAAVHRDDALVLLDGDELRDVASLSVFRLRNHVSLDRQHAPLGGEQEDVLVRVRHREDHDLVLFRHRRPLAPLSAPPLEGILLEALPAEEAVLREDHDDIRFGDEVFIRHFPLGFHNLRLAVVAETPSDIRKLVADHRVEQLRVFEDRRKVFDVGEQLLQLFLELLAFESRKALEAQFEDRLRLEGRELQFVHERVPGVLRRFGSADQRDDPVDHIERLHEAFDDVLAGLRLIEPVSPRQSGILPSIDHTLALLITGRGSVSLDPFGHRIDFRVASDCKKICGLGASIT